MEKLIDGIGKDAPIETNKNGGMQSSSPYAMHLIDPVFLREVFNDEIVYHFANFMINQDPGEILIIVYKLQKLAGISLTDLLLNISKVRKEATYIKGYPAQNWRLIPQEEHINHALVHYLAYDMGDTQDDHLNHCLCRLMFAHSTQPSKDFSYSEYLEEKPDETNDNSYFSNLISKCINSKQSKT